MQIPNVLSSSSRGDFDHNFAYFSVNSMSKGLMKNRIKIYDFKEFWFDGRERGKFNYVKEVKNIVDQLLSNWQIFGEKILSGETFLQHKKFDQNVPMLSHFLHFGGIARFMWSFGECIWYCKWTIHCYHCGHTLLPGPSIIIHIYHHHHIWSYMIICICIT